MRIAFIGLGQMGGPMATNLLRAGHTLVVYDVRRDAAASHLAAGATWAMHPAAAAREADLTITSLPGPAQIEQVALGPVGILEGAAPGTVFIDASTSSPKLIRRIHATFAERGIHVLDAPVSGETRGAKQGTLQFMVGGAEEIYDRIRPVLLQMGDKVSHMGVIGSGAIAKLCHNALFHSANLALAEVFTLGVKAGVKPEKLLERAFRN